MLTDAEIIAGQARLQSDKLKPADQSKMASAFELVMAGVSSRASYDFKGKLSALTDAGNSEKNAAQMAAICIKLEALGFGVGELQGRVRFKQQDQFIKLVLFAFSKIYPIPPEFASFSMTIAAFMQRRASTGSFRSDREF